MSSWTKNLIMNPPKKVITGRQSKTTTTARTDCHLIKNDLLSFPQSIFFRHVHTFLPFSPTTASSGSDGLGLTSITQLTLTLPHPLPLYHPHLCPLPFHNPAPHHPLPCLPLPPTATHNPCPPPASTQSSITLPSSRRKSLGRRTRSPALSRGRVESNARRRPLLRNLRRRHPHNQPAKPSEGGKRRTGRGSRRERLGKRENADRKRRLQAKRHERRRRIGRDGRRRPLPTTNDDAATRRRPTDAER